MQISIAEIEAFVCLRNVMETPIKYKAKTYPPLDRRSHILQSAYAQTIKEILLVMISAGYIYSNEEDLVDKAIRFTDRLIERTGEKF